MDTAVHLHTDIRYLKGVGEKRASFYRKLQIQTVRDLLYHFPRDYLDLSSPCAIAEAPLQEPCAVRARLVSKGREQRIRKGLSLFKLQAEDFSGRMEITMFNTRYTVDALKTDTEYLFYGRMGGSLLRREMSAPEIYSAGDDNHILPIYPQTAGLSSRVIYRTIRQAFSQLKTLNETLPDSVLMQYGLPSLDTALKAVHMPDSLAQALSARARFVFEELLVLSLALSTLHAERVAHQITPMGPVNMDPFYERLPFSPTGAQRRCIEESILDMCANVPMNRLIQGDVGSGKTLVVAAAVYFAVQNGHQAAVMVPTEILAEQHMATLSAMLEPLGVRCALFTGSTKTSQRRALLQGLEDSSVDLCIGTHALLSDGIAFRNLSLVVTDEQHRFGVAQRAKLSQKSEGCHVMVLSATPIPRTLSLIIYGDLKLSVIDELPPGRQEIDTYVIRGSKRARALGFIRRALDAGRQAYIVCPLVEQGELDTGLRPAVDYAAQLSEQELQGYCVGLMHGKMKAADKEATMRRFKNGEIQVLVSTTVVEVGVDVPNATIMLIENAERFGLSQLHQLRGRVGRGSEKSYCILVTDSTGALTRQRLDVMKKTTDGFQIAEHDLKLRGPGDFFGFRQHGLPVLKVADLAVDMEPLQAAQACAAEILKHDPQLKASQYSQLCESVNSMLASVGGRPN